MRPRYSFQTVSYDIFWHIGAAAFATGVFSFTALPWLNGQCLDMQEFNSAHGCGEGLPEASILQHGERDLET